MRRKKNSEPTIDVENIPYHIGFIMDGNGRWATRRGLPRTAGHRAGVDALTRVAEACRDLGVKVMSVYAFSTENFQRSDGECKFIFDLVERFAKEKTAELLKNNTRFVVSGDLAYSPKLPQSTIDALMEAQQKTSECTDLILNMCFSYGGHHEIVDAVNKLIKSGKTEVSEADIEANLYLPNVAPPDLIVRASGEQRLSNFLLWQSAYAELLFVEDFWPDFNAEIVRNCVIEYQKRNRRFGKV